MQQTLHLWHDLMPGEGSNTRTTASSKRIAPLSRRTRDQCSVQLSDLDRLSVTSRYDAWEPTSFSLANQHDDCT
jgi:hypothetical protein